MADDMRIALEAIARKLAGMHDGDILREGVRMLAHALMEAEAVAERAKASVRAKIEHPFRVVKRQFGYVKVRNRGLAKNTAQLTTLFALSNLWMVRHTVRVG